MNTTGRVDLMYLACNRLEFTQETFSTLIANTDWDEVHELHVYDDGSIDGTREWLAEAIKQAPAPTRFLRTNFGSPVTAMSHFIELAERPILAKTDNDAMLPPAWLRQSLDVLDQHPELTLLGIEALYSHQREVERPRTYAPARFISGLGLYRRSAFANSRPTASRKWFGLEEWQIRQRSVITCGWITPALPVFLLDRIPFDPWRSYSDQYIVRGWQRSWPRYDAACTLWDWRWPERIAAGQRVACTAMPQGDTRFLCALRIKNEAAHIAEVLSRALQLCGCAFIFDDHSTDETVSICQSFGERVNIFSTPFTGLDEARDKNYLLQKIISANPEWVLWIDGDEVLEAGGPAKIKQAVARDRSVAAYSLRIAYLWNDAQHVRVDGIFGRFTRPSLFRLKGQPIDRLRFAATGSGGNFHCGSIPQGLNGSVHQMDVRLKHYGYMEPERRRAKYEWYQAHDPGNVIEDHYRHLIEIPGAHYAPGPAQLRPWVE